jgi:hypothetical protein
MPTEEQVAAVSSAIMAIRNAQILLTQQIRTASETLIAIKLTHEYNNLDSCLSSLLQAQNAADDTVFVATTGRIKSTADSLKADAATVQSMIKDVQIAGKLIGYVTQALALIAKL